MRQEPGLSGEQWKEILVKIAQHLTRPASLCLIDSGPGIFAGQPNRLSIDLDGLSRASKFEYQDLKQACEKAGVLFNPKGEMEPDTPYLQIVEEGIVQVGRFKKKTKVFESGELTLTRPPVENIIASKLVRAAPKDIGDIAFLLGNHHVEKSAIVEVIKSFPGSKQERAEENLIYIDAILLRFNPDEGKARGKKAPGKNQRHEKKPTDQT